MPGEDDEGGDIIMLMGTELRLEWMKGKVIAMGGRVHCSKEGMIADALSSFVEDGALTTMVENSSVGRMRGRRRREREMTSTTEQSQAQE